MGGLWENLITPSRHNPESGEQVIEFKLSIDERGRVYLPTEMREAIPRDVRATGARGLVLIYDPGLTTRELAQVLRLKLQEVEMEVST